MASLPHSGMGRDGPPRFLHMMDQSQGNSASYEASTTYLGTHRYGTSPRNTPISPNLCYDARIRTHITSTLSRWQTKIPCRCRPSNDESMHNRRGTNWNGADAGPPEAFLQQLYRKITTFNATTHRLPTRKILHQSLVFAPCQMSID